MVSTKRGSGALAYFGKQLRKSRLEAHLTLAALAAQCGTDHTTLSRIENGHRGPTPELAAALDAVFPKREGWFTEFFEEMQSWIPAGFRAWPPHEEKAATLRTWTPGFIDGLFQTPAYARAHLETATSVAEVVNARFRARISRQQKVMERESPPMVWVIVDVLALFREVGSPLVMADQLDHLARLARLDHVTMQVLPAVGHPAGASSFVIADHTAGYAEHVVAGSTYTETETVTGLIKLFATIQAESEKASASLVTIERLADVWRSGVHPLTAALRADSA